MDTRIKYITEQIDEINLVVAYLRNKKMANKVSSNLQVENGWYSNEVV